MRSLWSYNRQHQWSLWRDLQESTKPRGISWNSYQVACSTPLFSWWARIQHRWCLVNFLWVSRKSEDSMWEYDYNYVFIVFQSTIVLVTIALHMDSKFISEETCKVTFSSNDKTHWIILYNKLYLCFNLVFWYGLLNSAKKILREFGILQLLFQNRQQKRRTFQESCKFSCMQ